MPYFDDPRRYFSFSSRFVWRIVNVSFGSGVHGDSTDHYFGFQIICQLIDQILERQSRVEHATTLGQRRHLLAITRNSNPHQLRGLLIPFEFSDHRTISQQLCGVSCFVWTVGPVERILDMSTPRPRREYSAEFRADAVRMVTELGKPRSQVARELELNVSTLGRWVATEIGTLGTGRGSARRAPDPESTDPHEMQREISRLREENEFLKKAAAFFAKEQL